MNVDRLMSDTVETCTTDSNLAEAVSIMWHHDCGAVPVVGADGKIVGIVTDRDICIAVATSKKLASQIRVGDVIAGGSHTCRPDDDVKSALDTMKKFRVRRLPVVDEDGKVLGVLSLTDILLQSRPSKYSPDPGMNYTDVMEALQSICEPRFEPSSAD